MSEDISKTSNFKSAKIWIMFRFYVLSFFKTGDTIQGGTLFKEIRYIIHSKPECIVSCPCINLSLINSTIFLVFATLLKRIDEKDKNSLFKRRVFIITVKSNKTWWYWKVNCHSQTILSRIVSELKDFFFKIWTKICSRSWALVILCFKCLAWVACLWSKTPMFKRKGMKREGLSLPSVFQYLFLKYDMESLWFEFGPESSLASKCQDLPSLFHSCPLEHIGCLISIWMIFEKWMWHPNE